ncbi:MAG: bifunctional 5,10-methylenetetrahydrofolate dehydrogenase/5,10-methenyltetrahydrofolate cyclohydrolase [Alphaproteobacteria bacterium]|nr:bifunctional 5,10-methylenetetrahydrofolate dehydrogenase/5,10-methenyltetrahydrofolate cyclohydrolase [Alphaproteobacteria bacterium]
MSANDLLGKPTANKIFEKVRREAEEQAKQGWKPKLVSITIGDTDAVDVYVRNQRRSAEKCNIEFEEKHIPASISQDELKVMIRQMNTNPSINGIIIQRPVPKHINTKEMQTYIHPLKDVEGMHPASIGNIVYNELDLAPCTAAAAVELLHATNLKMKGLEVVMIGHSAIVGKPAAFMMMAEGATVTVCNHMTNNLSNHTKHADAVIVATGVPNLIKADMIKKGAVVIDVGINVIKDKDGQEKIVGDVDYDSVKDVAGWITPVPGGVGPVTVSILMRNIMYALRRQKKTYSNKYGSES